MASINIKDRGISLNDNGFKDFSKHIQGNILKGHGRGHTSQILFKFELGKISRAKQFIQQFAHTDVTSAYQQEEDKAMTKRDGIQRFFVGLYLSSEGYRYLFGNDHPVIPTGDIFNQGMEGTTEVINDPPPNSWESGYTEIERVHGMILIAMGGEDNRERLEAKTNQLEKALAPIAKTYIERGDAFKNQNGDNIEHFGYVDGISQPRFFFEDFHADSNIDTNTSKWNPLMPASLVLVKENLEGHPDAYGSYLVFRKLKQHVGKFKAATKQLADALSITDSNPELAGALLIGRFENGVPVTLSRDSMNDATLLGPVVGKINNFDYSADADGAKCPFHAHIRKVNPRGDTNHPNFTGNKGQEKDRMMARRGITYGSRKQDPDSKQFIDNGDENVGLLFMSFQASLEEQFIFVQKNWANEPSFINEKTNIDPIIGQEEASGHHRIAQVYGDKNTFKSVQAFSDFVSMRGGEYFFAPSMDFLQNITNIGAIKSEEVLSGNDYKDSNPVKKATANEVPKSKTITKPKEPYKMG